MRMKKIFLFVFIGLILLAIPLTVFLMGQQQELRSRAAPASTLSLSPSTLTKKVGETFALEAKIDTGTNQVGVVQIRIIYDPAKLEAVDISNGPLAPSISVSGKIDPTGKASITVGAKNNTHPITGSGTIAIVTMKALAASGTPVSVRYSPLPDTYANALGEQENVLIGTTPANITIVNADGTTAATQQAQQTTTPHPTPTSAVVTFGGAQGLVYSPNTVTIQAGQSVSWRGDFAAHPLKSVDNLWNNVQTGTEFSHTFTAPGTYEYYCEIHGTETSGMKGKIIVSPNTTPPTTSLTPSLTPTPIQLASDSAKQASSSALTIESPTTNQEIATTTPTFIGKAPPESSVTLTIYSEPRTVVVTADANGNWTYTPIEGLEPGPHTVTAMASDPNTGQTSTASVPFVLGVASESAIPVSGNREVTIILIAIGVILLSAGLTIPLFIR